MTESGKPCGGSLDLWTQSHFRRINCHKHMKRLLGHFDDITTRTLDAKRRCPD